VCVGCRVEGYACYGGGGAADKSHDYEPGLDGELAKVMIFIFIFMYYPFVCRAHLI
jgi:hypothetical protein